MKNNIENNNNDFNTPDFITIRNIKRIPVVISTVISIIGLITAFIYFLNWSILRGSFLKFGLVDYVSYLDFATLVIKSKMNVITFLFIFALYIAGLIISLFKIIPEENKKYNLDPYGSLIDEKEQNCHIRMWRRNLHRPVMLFVYLLVTGVIMVGTYFFYKSISLVYYIALGYMIVLPLVLLAIKKCDKECGDRASRFLITFFPTSVVISYVLTMILIFLYGMLFEAYFGLVGFVGIYFLIISMIYLIIHECSVNKLKLNQKISYWIMLLVLSVVLPLLLFLDLFPNPIVFANAGEDPRNITLIEVQSKSSFYGQRLEMVGFKRIATAESNNIPLAGIALMNYIENDNISAINESVNFCKSKHNRNILQEIAYHRDNVNNFSIIESTTVCQAKFESYYTESHNFYSNYHFAQKAFVQQKIDDNYIYLIFGAHIPFYLRNKSIVITPVMTDENTFKYELIKFDSENDLKGFEILYSTVYCKSESDANCKINNNEHISKIKDLLFTESNMN